MNAMTVFENPAFGRMRLVDVDGDPWFVGRDAAEALGYSDAKAAVRDHVDAEDKKVIQRGQITPLENHIPKSALQVNFVPADIPNRGLTVINESGLYSLIFSSKLPNAKSFKRWVTAEILPSIRKTGSYHNPKSVTGSGDRDKLMRAQAMLLNAKSRVATQMQKLWDRAGVKPAYQALALNAFFDGLEVPRIALQGVTTALYDKTAIAEKLGVVSVGGKPHPQAIGAIIAKLDIRPDEVAETPYSRNGHDGVAPEYAESVIRKVAVWIVQNKYPGQISNGRNVYRVRYTRMLDGEFLHW